MSASEYGGDSEECWLLPEGIEELLPVEAARAERLRRELLDLCSRWGYELVIPPLIEHTDSLLIGLGRDLDRQTFTLVDQLSGRQLGIRPDITPQVARIDAHSLRRDGPVRLCYAGTVLHTRRRSPFASRAPVQLGAEFYGESGREADVEIISLMLETLRCTGLNALTLDVGDVGIFRELMSHLALPRQTSEALFAALQDKSSASIAELAREAGLDADIAEMLQCLCRLHGDRRVLDDAITLFSSMPAGLSERVRGLGAVAEAVASRAPGVTLHFDVCELHGYHYHTGLVFAAYTPGCGEAVANGGRYDDIGRVFGRARPATGFNTDLNALLQLVPSGVAAPQGVFVAHGIVKEAWSEIRRLRDAGERIVEGMPGQAGSACCDRELRRGTQGTWHIISG